MSARGLGQSPSTGMHSYVLKGLYTFAVLLLQCLYVVHFLSCFLRCLLYKVVSRALSVQGLAH